MKNLSYLKDILPKPKTRKTLDAITILSNYCQVNFTTPPEKLKEIIHPRFEPITILLPGSNIQQAIISAVIFQEKDFHFPLIPYFGNYTFNQVNYRSYCIDKETGLRTIWFLGTIIDHWSIFVPRNVLRFPWHRAKISFETDFQGHDEHNKYYEKYHMTAKGQYGTANIHVKDLKRKAEDGDFPGFPNKETALIYLTHSLSAHFFSRGKKEKLKCLEIWHEPMDPNVGVFDDKAVSYFDLFEKLGLITREQKPYNILLQPQIQYDVYLPPIESITKNSRYHSP